MRIPLRLGQTELLLQDTSRRSFSHSSLVRRDLHAARTFLRRYETDPLSMGALRRAAREAHHEAYRFTDDEVVEWFSWLMTTGQLQVQQMDLQERRYFQLLVEEGETQSGVADGDGRKWPPDPLVPPEYPLLAWLESNEVKKGCAFLCDLLEKELYMGFDPSLPDSSVAPVYMEVLGLEQQEIRAATDHVVTQITNLLWTDEGLSVPKSTIAPTYIGVATESGLAVRETALSFVAQLDTLLAANAGFTRPASVVAVEYVNVARETGSQVRSAADDFANSLSRLMGSSES